MSSEDMAGGDEYHTLEELYTYRMLYNAHAAQGWLSAGIPVVKSWHHSDGEECFGGDWFIVTGQLPTGQVSNHYPAKDWDLFDVPWVDVAPEWDGHTPEQAADRLRKHLKGTQKVTTPRLCGPCTHGHHHYCMGARNYQSPVCLNNIHVTCLSRECTCDCHRQPPIQPGTAAALAVKGTRS